MEHSRSQVSVIKAFKVAFYLHNFKAKRQTIVIFSKRLLVQAVSMTGCDLSSSSKPWSVQEKTTKVVYDEFYEQVLRPSLS